MRALILLATIGMAAPTSAAGPSQADRGQSANCPKTSTYLAESVGAYRGKGVAPKKLNELPPAVTYMAVYRQIGGCEAPLKLSEYRKVKG